MVRLMLHSGKAFQFLLTGGPQGGVARWRNYSHPRYSDVVARWTERDLGPLSAAELLAGVGELLDAGTEYYTSVQTIIPIAATSEILFTQFYDRLVRRDGDPAAATFLLGFDSLPIRSEKSLYDLAVGPDPSPGSPRRCWPLRPSGWSPSCGTRTPSPTNRPGRSGVLVPGPSRRASGTVYNLDFANAVPADDPAPLLDTLRFYLRGEGGDPVPATAGFGRAARTADPGGCSAGWIRSGRARSPGCCAGPSGSLRSARTRWATSAWPGRRCGGCCDELGRPPGRRRGAQRARRGVLAAPRGAVGGGRVGCGGSASWASHRAAPGAVAGSAPGHPTAVLPRLGWMKVFDGMLPAATAGPVGRRADRDRGQRRRVTATARVLSDRRTSGRCSPGDVLVASITTPAWTPLFAMAAAVVTDIGGPLSHSSIVAREYGIPAVLGTAVATRRITSGQAIPVDGDAGRVLLTTDRERETPPEPPPHTGAPDWPQSSIVRIGIGLIIWALPPNCRKVGTTRRGNPPKAGN